MKILKIYKKFIGNCRKCKKKPTSDAFKSYIEDRNLNITREQLGSLLIFAAKCAEVNNGNLKLN